MPTPRAEIAIAVHPDALLADLVCYASAIKRSKARSDEYRQGQSEAIDELVVIVKKHTHIRIIDGDK